MSETNPPSSVALIYHPDYQGYNFRHDHPLQPLRMQVAVELIRACGLLDAPNYIAAPDPASDAELLTVHHPDYIACVKEADHPPRNWSGVAAQHGLGPGDTPAFPGMHAATALIAGGSLLAARLVTEGKVASAFNIGGGLHHAHPDCAAGFCIYNDPAIAIAYLREVGLRVMYIDTDVHHGDGVQEVFYEDDRVLTLSIHETGRFLFPGTGEVSERGRGRGYGYAVNLPFEPYTDDDSYIACFDALVPAIARAFRPDVIVSQQGADGHFRDPLAHLGIGTRTYQHIYAAIRTLTDELCSGRLVALGGGGYDLYHAVPRVWTIAFAALGHRLADLPELIPPAWREQTATLAPRAALPTHIHDRNLIDELPPDRRAAITARNQQTAKQARDGTLKILAG